jgi:hypothetical protein
VGGRIRWPPESGRRPGFCNDSTTEVRSSIDTRRRAVEYCVTIVETFHLSGSTGETPARAGPLADVIGPEPRGGHGT